MMIARNTDNTVLATRQFLKLLKVNVTDVSLEHSLTEHPDYPTIISISDALIKWKVSNMIVKMDSENLAQLDTPFIARMVIDEGVYVVVKEITSRQVTYLSPRHLSKEITTDINDFKNKAAGIGILAEANELSGEEHYKRKKTRELLQASKIPFLFFMIFIFTLSFSVIAFFTTVNTGIAFITLAWIKFSGCLISGILLTHEVNQNNPLIRFVCKPGKKINCTAILNSKGAKLLGLVSWSEIGFFYFGGSYLALLLSRFDPDFISAIAWMNVFALPYIFYSVVYQWRIAKQWCILCLIVQSLLLGEAVVALTQHLYTIRMAADSTDIFIFLLSFLLPVISWIFLKQYLVKAAAAEGYRKEYLRLKHDIDVFKSHITAQRKINTGELQQCITWGNINAINTLTMVCSPYCRPCALASPVVSDIIANLDDIKIQMLFDVTGFTDDRIMNPIRRLLGLYQDKTEEGNIEEILDDWWLHAQEDDYAGFAKKYGSADLDKVYDEQIKEMHNWCVSARVEHTPTFFLNGFELSGTYTIEDLRSVLISSRWNWNGL